MEKKLAAAAAMERSEDSRPPGPRAAPWLVFSHRAGIENDQVFFNICEPNQVYNKNIPEMNRQSFDYWQSPSHEGWLVILCVEDEYFENSKSKKLGESFLWNPASLEIVELPCLCQWIKSGHHHIIDCLLSSPPTNSISMVFWLIYSRDCSTNTELLFCRPGEKEWRIHKFDDGISNTPRSLLWFKGKLYLTCPKNRYLEIEIVWSENDETLFLRSFVINKRFEFPSKTGISSPVVINHIESGDELFMVVQFVHPCVEEEVANLLVCRFNMSLMEFEEVRSLGDHVLFLGRKTNASCSAAEMGLTKGCVYYVRPKDETSLYKFDLEDNSISVSLPAPNLQASSLISPDWITIPTVNRRILLKEDKKKEEQNNNVVNWITSSPEMLMIPSSSPWLVFFKKNETICYFIDPMNGSKKYQMNISGLFEYATIRFSKGGWLLMFDGKQTLFFFNPFIRKLILLPDIPDICSDNFAFTGLCFSSVPTSPDCVVFAITGWQDDQVNIRIILRGVESWINVMPKDMKIPYTKRSMEFLPCLNNPVYHEKAFYRLDQNGTLGVFRYSQDDLMWRVLDKPRPPCTSRSIYQSFLVECEGKLLSVFLGHLGKWVRVFKLDFSNMEWVEVPTLGKHLLFISHTSCLSAVAPNNLMENKIYFSRFHGEGILFY